MADVALQPLPRGRHGLTREQVTETQRLRLVIAMADAMAEGGYVGTPVAAVLKRAGVSRETFYQLYDDKLACFLDALDFVGEVLVADLGAAVTGTTADVLARTPLARAERAISRYLDTLVRHPAFARLYLVEVHAAGAAAMERRARLQQRVVDALCALFDARDASARFALQAFVAAISSLVTLPLVSGDHEAIRALRRPLVEHLRMLVEVGPLSARP